MPVRGRTPVSDPRGRFVLPIDRSQDEYIDTGISRIKVYPDNPDNICRYFNATRLKLEKQFETEFVYILVEIL